MMRFARLGNDCVKTGYKAMDVSQDARKATVYFQDPTNENTRIQETADLVIAADGYSLVRQKYYPERAPPLCWHQFMAWDHAATRISHRTHDGPSRDPANRKNGDYPISPDNEKGETLINWVAEANRYI